MRARSRELALAALGFAVAALAVYGRIIADGGLWFDDWRAAGVTRSAGSLGEVSDGFAALNLNIRPWQALVFWVQYAGLGDSAQAARVAGVLMGVAASLALYAVLREAGAERVLAGAAGALALVFPFSDSLRLWPAAGSSSLALALALAGAALVLRGLRRPGRSWLAWVAAGVALDVAGVLIIEHPLAVIGVSAVAALALRPGRRAVGTVIVLLAGGVVAGKLAQGGAPAPSQPDLAATLHHLRTSLSQSWDLLGVAATPFNRVHTWAAIACLLVAVAGAVAERRLPAGDAVRAWLRQALLLLAFGVLLVLAACVVLAPASDFYVPLQLGQGNRTNAAAGLGWAMVFTALAALAAGLGARVARPAVAAAAVVAIVGASWAGRTATDAQDWITAVALQGRVVATAAAVPEAELPGDARIFVFGAPRTSGPETIVFQDASDLTYALRFALGRDVTAAPVFAGQPADCAVLTRKVPRGKLYFLDAELMRVIAIPDRATCEQTLPSLRGGPDRLYQ